MTTAAASKALVVDLRAATVRIALPRPMRFGDYVVSEREYAIVSARDGDGREGLGFGLTRGGPVAAIVDRLVAPLYTGAPVDDPAAVFALARRRHPGTLVSGVGLRALSLTDLAAWDLAARREGQPLQRLLGGDDLELPSIALVGFPPDAAPDEVAQEAAELAGAGFRRLKLPVAATPAATRARLTAVREAIPEAALMLDVAWSWRAAAQAVEEARQLLDLELAWIEDPFVPGDAALHASLRRAVPIPLAVGDEQGGAYFPEALLAADAIDVLRVDATCMGGVSGLRALRTQGLPLSAHIYPAIHGPLLCALGAGDATVEWARPGQGVDPLGETVWPRAPGADGRVAAAATAPGFGFSLDGDQLREHDLDDPRGIFGRG